MNVWGRWEVFEQLQRQPHEPKITFDRAETGFKALQRSKLASGSGFGRGQQAARSRLPFVLLDFASF